MRLMFQTGVPTKKPSFDGFFALLEQRTRYKRRIDFQISQSVRFA
jgi:hypothetical protein